MTFPQRPPSSSGDGGSSVTTVWHSCPGLSEASPSFVAFGFYASLVLLGVLTISLWLAHRRATGTPVRPS